MKINIEATHWRKKLDKEFSPTDDTSDGIYIIIAF